MTLLTNSSEMNVALVKGLAKKLFKEPNLAALCVCQAILESDLEESPPSKLAFKYNNLFGIKGAGTAGSVVLKTYEYINNKMTKVDARFAHNKTVEDSLTQYKYLITKPRYNNLHDPEASFEELAHRIMDDGYATDPGYFKSLLSVYKRHF